MADIAALIDELRAIAEMSDLPELLVNAANALERQQAVVEAARAYMRYHATYGAGAERMALGEALAALDAPPEGDEE